MLKNFFSLVFFVAALTFSNNARADEWLKAETKNFIITSNWSEKDTIAYAKNLEKFRFLLINFYQTKEIQELESPKLNVYLLKRDTDLLQVWPKRPKNVVGFANSSVDGVFAFSLQFGGKIQNTKEAKKQDENESQIILFHEYTHLLMQVTSGFAYPKWYIEGFAEFYSTTKITDDDAVVGYGSTMRLYTLLREGEIKYEDLLRDNHNGISDSNYYNRFYAQSWLLTHYLMSDPKLREKMPEYFIQLLNGKDEVVAFEEVFSIKVKDLSKILNKYLYKYVATIYKFSTSQANIDIQLTKYPPSINKIILLDAMIRFHSAKSSTEAALVKIRNEAAKYPDDIIVQEFLARAEVINGNPTNAIKFYEAAISKNPNNPEFYSRLGEAYWKMRNNDKEYNDENTKNARKYFYKAYKLDPNNARNLYFLSHTSPNGLINPDESYVNAAYEAYLIAPSVTEYAFNAVFMLIGAKRFDEAKNLLVSFANDPHEKSRGKISSAAIKFIDEGGKPEEIITKIMKSMDEINSTEEEG